MKPVTQFIVHLTDLIEAEGRALRKIAVRLSLGLSLSVVGAVLLLLGCLGLLAGLWLGLEKQMNPAWAWAIIGLLSLGLAAGFVYVAGRLTK